MTKFIRADLAEVVHIGGNKATIPNEQNAYFIRLLTFDFRAAVLVAYNPHPGESVRRK
jgi:hypothetical protein